MPDVGAEGVDPLPVSVERKRVVLAAPRPRTRRRSAREVARLPARAVRRGRVAPDLARDLCEPPLRVVDVALHLARRDRRRREPPVAEALRVARVLPRLVLEPARRPPLVLDEAVAVAIAVFVDPPRAPRAQAPSARARARRRPSSATPPTGGRGRAAWRRRCRNSGRTSVTAHLPRRTSCTIFPGSASRDGSASVACSAASSRSAPRASSGPKRIVCRHVISVSRPNTVMNHGIPAAGRGPMRSAARSRDRLLVREPQIHPARADLRHAQTPRRERVARRAAAPGRSAARAGPAPRSPTSHVDAQLPGLARAECDRERDAASVRLGAGLREEDVGRAEAVAVHRARSRCRCRSGCTGSGSGVAEDGSPREKSHSLTEMMSAKSAASSTLEPKGELARRHVGDDEIVLHAVADEPLALDRRSSSAVQRIAEEERGGEVLDRCPRRAAAAACRRSSAAARTGSACRRRRGRASPRRRRRARRRCRRSILRGSSAAASGGSGRMVPGARARSALRCKDAGRGDSGAIAATEDAAAEMPSAAVRHRCHSARPSYWSRRMRPPRTGCAP